MMYQDDQGRQFKAYRWNGTEESKKEIEKVFGVEINFSAYDFFVKYPSGHHKIVNLNPAWCVFYLDPDEGNFSWKCKLEFNKIYAQVK